MTRDEAPGPRGIVGCVQGVEKLDLINTGTLGWCAVWFFCLWRQNCSQQHALLETILCKFGQISATGNALMLLETILCEYGRICATGSALMQLETIVC